MKDIKDYKGTKTVILCTTQQEWDKITALLGYTWKYANWSEYKQNSCITCEENLYSDLNYYNKQKYTILPASDFLNNEENLTVDDLVKYEYYYTKDKISDFWMIYRFKQKHGHNQADYTVNICRNQEFKKNDWCSLESGRITRKATAEEIKWIEACSKADRYIEFDKIPNEEQPKQEEKLTLLEQTKLKYPIGTGIVSTLGSEGVINTDNYIDDEDYIYANGGEFSIYNKKLDKWAEIIQKVSKTKDLSTLKDCYIELNSEDEYNQITKWLESLSYKLWNGFSWNYKRSKNFTDNQLYLSGKNEFWITNGLSTRQFTISDLEQYGFKYVKPLEAKVPVIGKVYDSVPEYYEYTAEYNDSPNFTKGKIYKCKNPKSLEDIGNFIDDKGTENGFSGNNYRNFKPSTFIAFQEQECKSKCVTYTGSYVTGIDLYMNETIEIGDEVEVIEPCRSGNKKKGQRFIVTEINLTCTLSSFGKCVGLQCKDGWWEALQSCKVTKKANKTQSTTGITKRVDSLSPKVETNLSSLIKIRNSKPSQKVEKRVKLTIKSTKQLKLKQNG